MVTRYQRGSSQPGLGSTPRVCLDNGRRLQAYLMYLNSKQNSTYVNLLSNNLMIMHIGSIKIQFVYLLTLTGVREYLQ